MIIPFKINGKILETVASFLKQKTIMKKFDINQFGTACQDAQEYYATKPDFKTAWQDCHRGDWMLWIAQKLDIDKRKLTLAKALCAKTVIHLMKDERSKKAVETAEKYGNMLVGDEELNAAAAAAYAAAAAAYAADAYAAYAYAAYDAAAAAAYAADAADAAAAADADATDSADAAADAAYAADADADARIQNRLLTANICRQVLTEVVFKAIQKI